MTYLASERRVLGSTSPTHLPAVLDREEVRAVLAHLEGTTRLIALILYGAGLRLEECLTLRLKDLDFARREIHVRRGKGGKDRVDRSSCRLRWCGRPLAGPWTWRGSGSSLRRAGTGTPRAVWSVGIMCTRR